MRSPGYISIRYAAILLIALLCSNTHSHAQSAETPRKLQEVVKRKQRKAANGNDDKLQHFSPGMQTYSFDSATLQQYALQHIDKLLAQQAPVFIKSYGINSMATMNLRGASAAQSQVYWNGVPLNNAAIGASDLTLLNTSSFDHIRIAYGSSAALWGSGNVGGALVLENELYAFDSIKRRQTKADVEFGSYAQLKGYLQHSFTNSRWHASIRLLGQSAQNNFPYTDRNGQQATMPNAALSSYSGIGNIAYKINAYSHISAALWYQYYDRSIPPALFEASSQKQQTDRSLRLMLDWQHQKSTANKWYAKAALLQDNMRYDDPAAQLHSNNTTYQYFQEAGWLHRFNARHQLLLFMPVNISWMRPSGDSLLRTQTKAALAAAYKYENLSGRLNLALNLRGEAINTQSVLLPGFNASYRLWHWLQLKGNVQRTYRAPTLNEWYYTPGGNPKLKPESGWSADAGYELKWQRGPWLLEQQASVFNRDIHDWVLWFGGSIWTPHNIAEVHSRGLETINRARYQWGQWQLHAGVNTSFVLATTVSSYLPGDGSIGKQIPYTPRYNGQANIGCSYRKLYINYNHTYTGYRYVTTDESQYLAPYQTGNLFTSYAYSYRKVNCKISVQCNNLWNTQYQVVNLRPMPGRNWLAGLGIIF